MWALMLIALTGLGMSRLRGAARARAARPLRLYPQIRPQSRAQSVADAQVLGPMPPRDGATAPANPQTDAQATAPRAGEERPHAPALIDEALMAHLGPALQARIIGCLSEVQAWGALLGRPQLGSQAHHDVREAHAWIESSLRAHRKAWESLGASPALDEELVGQLETILAVVRSIPERHRPEQADHELKVQGRFLDALQRERQRPGAEEE